MKASPVASSVSAKKSGPIAVLPKLVLVVLIQGSLAKAEIVAPYQPDEHTLHLWHMNAPVAPVADAVANGLDLAALDNGATLGNESFTGAKNFGTAVGTYVGNPAMPPGCAGQSAGLSAQPLLNGREDNVSVRYAGAKDAFTYEAIVRIDFDPTANFGPDGWGQGRSFFMQILSGDADENTDRVFQFRLAPIGTLNGNVQPLLEFINLNQGSGVQSLTATIPTEGAEAIRMGNWYHLAVSYDGQPDQTDNLRFYWTQVQDKQTKANLIGTGQMTRSLPTGGNPDFTIGQTGRQSPVTTTPNNNFVGLIDEVRISGVARSPGEMLFADTSLVGKPTAVEPKPVTQPAAIASTKVSNTNIATAITPVVAVAAVTNTAKSSTPDPVTQMSGAVVRGPVGKPRFAIMFSCREPDEAATTILQTLKAATAKASFFVSSDFLNKPAGRQLAQSVLAQGHYLGPQADTWTQLDLATTANSALPADVAQHLGQLAALGVGQKEVRYFLPTSDQLTSAIGERTRALGLTMVAGTPGTLSFATATVEGTKEFASSQAIIESILKVEHESKGLNGFLLLFPLDSGAGRADRFYPRFGELIGSLQKCGYELVRVDELLDSAATQTVQPPLANFKRP